MKRQTPCLTASPTHPLTQGFAVQRGDGERGRGRTAAVPLSDTPYADTLQAVPLTRGSVSFNRDAKRSFSYKASRCNFL